MVNQLFCVKRSRLAIVAQSFPLKLSYLNNNYTLITFMTFIKKENNFVKFIKKNRIKKEHSQCGIRF